MKYSGIAALVIIIGLNLIVWSGLGRNSRSVEAPRLFGGDSSREGAVQACGTGFVPECASLFGAVIGQMRDDALKHIRSTGCQACRSNISEAILTHADQREVHLKEGWIILSEAAPDLNRRVELFSFGESGATPIHGIRAELEFQSDYPPIEQIQAELSNMFGAPGVLPDRDDSILQWHFDADGHPKDLECPVASNEQCIEFCPTSLELYFSVKDQIEDLEYFRPRYGVCNTSIEVWIQQAELHPGKASSVTVDIIDFDRALNQLGSILALE